MNSPEIDRQPLPTLQPQDESAKLPWESIDPEEPAAAIAAAHPPKMPHPAAAPAQAVAAAAAHPEQATPPADEHSDEHLSAQAFLGDNDDPVITDTPTIERGQSSVQSAPRPKWTGALSADEGSAPDPTAEQLPVPSGVLSDPGSEQPRQQWADAGEPVTMETPVEAPVRASLDLAGPDDESVSHLWAEPAEPEEVEVVAKVPAATIIAPAAMAPVIPAMPAAIASAVPVDATIASASAIDRDAEESVEAEDEPDEFADADDAADSPAQLQSTGGGWTIPLLCLGIGLIACCVVIPQADANGRLFYERQMLQADLESVEKQVAVNGEFIKKVMDDPTLAERLAGRQMKTIRKGQKVLALKHEPADTDMSPFALVTVAPPALPPPYKPIGGGFASLCCDARSRLYIMGAAMTMIAAGLVLGVGSRKSP
ncbi:MAG: hypothetical protein JWN24_3396 [Phycisphaerales bacterium]|nr:hypothetical protein [Phycisphaerales bacterium]